MGFEVEGSGLRTCLSGLVQGFKIRSFFWVSGCKPNEVLFRVSALLETPQ